MHTRNYDILVWGATGFTGQLVAEYLLRHDGPVLRRDGHGQRLRWALGGRNLQKLQAVRQQLTAIDPAAAQLPLVVTDAADEPALLKAISDFAVVCTTVGPYALYGTPMVAACAATGTHYCDLTGEVQWLRQMIDAHHGAALQSGAKIVPTCGFDSIPSDLGAHQAIAAFADTHQRMPTAVTTYVRDLKGSFSGGTVASQVSISEQSADPALAAHWRNPYSLVQGDTSGLPPVGDIFAATLDAEQNCWTSTFLMAPCNAKIVRRSLALNANPAIRGIAYQEKMAFRRGFKGWALANSYNVGLALMQGSMAVGWMRRAMHPMLPQPGDGPDEQARIAGRFVFEVVASDASDRVQVTVRGDKDPGYGSTSGMLAEAALCLALDGDRLPQVSGFLTPASAMGGVLVERLVRAGVTFSGSKESSQ